MIKLLERLDRSRFAPTLVLARKEGIWLDHVPGDVPIVDLGVSRLRGAVVPLVRVLRRESPDVLLAVSSGPNQVAALAHRLAPDARRRLFLSERSTFSAVRRERRAPWLPVKAIAKMLYRQADGILAVSDGVAEDLVTYLGLDAKRVTAVYNPVVDASLQAAAETPADHPWLSQKTPVMLAVGRLVEQKDYPTLLRAFAAVRQSRPVRLIVLGEGNLRGDLETLAAELGVADDVDFAGFVQNPFPYMASCDVYALSSRIEGLPGALIQALACGAPVVSTDCPSGPAEIIKPGETGLLVPVGDVDALAAALGRVLDDDGLRASFSTRSRASVRRFDVDTVVRRYENVLS